MMLMREYQKYHIAWSSNFQVSLDLILPTAPITDFFIPKLTQILAFVEPAVQQE